MIAFIDEYRDRFPVDVICRTLQSTPAGFLTSRGYRAAKNRAPSARSVRDQSIGTQLVDLFHRNYGNSLGGLGVEKMQEILQEEGIDIGRDQVRRLMRMHHLYGQSKGKIKKTTIGDREKTATDKIQRQFTASKPNELWVADITYVRTRSGFVYTAFVLDVFNREIVGWNTTSVMPTELPLEALNQAIMGAKNQVDGLIHHSDKGSQYTSITYTHRLESLGMIPSTGKTGDAYDNAMAESLNSSYKRELITRFGPWQNLIDVELATMNWVHWYNNTRPHGSLGYQSPRKYKNSYQEKQPTPEKPTPALGKP